MISKLPCNNVRIFVGLSITCRLPGVERFLVCDRGSAGRLFGLVSAHVHLVAQATPSSSDDAPLSFIISVCSVAVMLAVFGASFLTYLLRHAVERLERLVQGIDQNRYAKHIQGPAAAVIVAAVSGYGINVVTQDRGLLGYVGFLLAMPIPLVMVTWSGFRAVRQTEFERQWPPNLVPAYDRVKIRNTLRRVEAESAHLGTADVAQISTVLNILLDEALPALRERRDRSLRRWLRDHRVASIVVLAWIVLTLACAMVAVLPRLQGGSLRAVYLFAGFVFLVFLIKSGLLAVLRRHSRYRYNALTEEVAESAGRILRRITEHRLGLPAQSRSQVG